MSKERLVAQKLGRTVSLSTPEMQAAMDDNDSRRPKLSSGDSSPKREESRSRLQRH